MTKNDETENHHHHIYWIWIASDICLCRCSASFSFRSISILKSLSPRSRYNISHQICTRLVLPCFIMALLWFTDVFIWLSIKLNSIHCSRQLLRVSRRYYSKGKVTVLSPHPGSELCSADFDKYLPWSLGLYTPYPFGYPAQLPGECTAAHTQLDATAYKSALTGTHSAPGSRAAMQREVPCSGAQRADAPTGYWARDLT